MPEKPIPEVLADVLRRHANVNAFTKDWPQAMRLELFSSNNPEREQLFRCQLAEAILNDTITPAQYERLTDEDFDTPEDFQNWLLTVWKALYGDAPVTLKS